MYRSALKNNDKIFSVAPMMDWTDRHCRYFHRTLTKQALLYSEMVTADAVIHGQRERLIGFSKQEHPLAIQLGGSDPKKLQEAAKIAEDFGYDEVNLNVGCPSDSAVLGLTIKNRKKRSIKLPMMFLQQTVMRFGFMLEKRGCRGLARKKTAMYRRLIMAWFMH